VIRAGEFSDTLRALGKRLAETGASGIEIADQSRHWLVASQRASDTFFQFFELESLRAAARQQRGVENHSEALDLSEILRTLGHILDAANATTFLIRELPDGFRLSMTVGAEESARIYRLEEIGELAARQRRERQQRDRQAGLA
jgi:hypothetical protein